MSEFSNRVLEIVREITNIDELDLDSTLDITEWDSLAKVTFITDIDTEFGKIIAPEDLANATTIADLAALVESSQA